LKSTYAWYLNAHAINRVSLWNDALLTVDTNVLLDLYRYHEETRQGILNAITYFSGRTWLSSQVCDEFFRNRKRVISSVNLEFAAANKKLDEYGRNLEKTILELSSIRVIPSEIIKDFHERCKIEIKKTTDDIKESRDAFPDFLVEDPILNALLELFDGAVGEKPTSEELNVLHNTAEQRQKDEVPPGYLDSKKEGKRSFGDFLLWDQTIEHAKKVGRPVILVTSEQKDDWWEIHSGKTVGPRMEMVREAAERSGQMIYIIHTEYFAKVHGEIVGSPITPEAVAEIKSVSNDRVLLGKISRSVVRISQDVNIANEFQNYGEIHIDLVKPILSFTCSGKLYPKMIGPPLMSARLVSGPEEMPKFHISPGTGTTFDFNVMIRSLERDILLPVGRYVFAYEADRLDIDIDLDDLE
jgi:PIN like domain